MHRLATALALLLIPTMAATAFAFESDDFHCPGLQSRWDFVNPLADGSADAVGSGTGQAYAELTLPAGTPHDAWGAGGVNQGIRLMQNTADTDLEIEVHWLSEPTGGFQDQGILIEQDSANWVRFDFYHNNSSLKAFAGRTSGGVNTAVINANIAAGSAQYLRVTRTGNNWLMSISPDGITYTDVTLFAQALSAAKVGVYAGNPVDAPAWTSQVDWFFNTASPVDPEDSLNTGDCEEPVSVEPSTWSRIKSSYHEAD